MLSPPLGRRTELEALKFKGLGFKDESLMFKVQDLRFRVLGFQLYIVLWLNA